MTKESFGTLKDTTQIDRIRLRAGRASCTILTYGAALQSLSVPDKAGAQRDILLGYDTIEEYIANDGYLGAVVGRYANRIANGRFSLNGKDYSLACNDNANHLHGGKLGFSMRVWRIDALTDSSVTLSLDSADGEEGYPGAMHISVCYTLTDSALRLRYEAVSDRDTVCNLTNHAYFNLNGHAAGSVLAHQIQILASQFTPADVGSIPTGELAPVAGTPMDLRKPTKIGAHIADAYEPLKQAKGYDHNYVLDDSLESLHPAARVFSEESGIELLVRTTMPGVQFYTANYLSHRNGKGGAIYEPRYGFCLETQYFPNSPNEPAFPSATLRASQKYAHTTEYAFTTQKA